MRTSALLVAWRCSLFFGAPSGLFPFFRTWFSITRFSFSDIGGIHSLFFPKCPNSGISPFFRNDPNRPLRRLNPSDLIRGRVDDAVLVFQISNLPG